MRIYCVLVMPHVAIPSVWLGSQGTVWRSVGSGETSGRPPGITGTVGKSLEPNAANLLAAQPVQRTAESTGLYGTGGARTNTNELFAPYKEEVFGGQVSQLGIDYGSGKKYDGDGNACGHDGPALTGLLLKAFRLSYAPDLLGGRTGGFPARGQEGGSIAGTHARSIGIRASDSSDERFDRGNRLLASVPIVEDWTRIAEAEGTSGELLLRDLETIRSLLPSARGRGYVNEYAVDAWVMRVTRNMGPVPKEVSDSEYYRPGDEELRELHMKPTERNDGCDLKVIAPAGQLLLHASRVLGTVEAAAAVVADSSNEALVERHATSIAKAKRLIDKKMSVLRAQTRGSRNDALLSASGMVLRDGDETWRGGRVTGYVKKQKRYHVHWDGDDEDIFTLHSFEEMCGMARFVIRWEVKSSYLCEHRDLDDAEDESETADDIIEPDELPKVRGYGEPFVCGRVSGYKPFKNDGLIYTCQVRQL